MTSYEIPEAKDTGNSFRSNPSKDSIENKFIESSFKNTKDDFYEHTLQSSVIPDIPDNDLDFTKINLKTVDNYGTHLRDQYEMEKTFQFVKPEKNLTVIGKGDNIKVDTYLIKLV